MPLKMMGGMVKDKNLEIILKTVEVFINSASKLMGVFNNYSGDDFCAGIFFGQIGSQTLVNISKPLVELSQPSGGLF